MTLVLNDDHAFHSFNARIRQKRITDLSRPKRLEQDKSPIRHQKSNTTTSEILIFSYLEIVIVNPWGVEPQSKEPESFILSIELRVQETAFWAIATTKLLQFS